MRPFIKISLFLFFLVSFISITPKVFAEQKTVTCTPDASTKTTSPNGNTNFTITCPSLQIPSNSLYTAITAEYHYSYNNSVPGQNININNFCDNNSPWSTNQFSNPITGSDQYRLEGFTSNNYNMNCQNGTFTGRFSFWDSASFSQSFTLNDFSITATYIPLGDLTPQHAIVTCTIPSQATGSYFVGTWKSVPISCPALNLPSGSFITQLDAQTHYDLSNVDYNANHMHDVMFNAPCTAASDQYQDLTQGTNIYKDYTLSIDQHPNNTPCSGYWEFETNAAGNYTINDISLVAEYVIPTDTLAPSPTAIPNFSISGNVYIDTNQNGIQDSGEQGYAGATVTLDSGQTATTDANGNYSLPTLTPGTYTETLTLPNGYTATTTNPATISLAANTTQNFGIAQSNSLVTAINAGGNTAGNFVTDTDFTGGTQYTSSATVDTTGVANPAPQAVYQNVRYGNFTYTIPNLTPNGTYTVRLHFNELYWGTGGDDATGRRVFNVSVNGTQSLSNYDIYAKAGGANKAIVEQLPATADSNGNIALHFTTVTDNAMVNGIELYNGTLPSPTPTATPTPASSAIINAGGNTAGNFVSDKDYIGGQPYTSSASVDTSSVTNTAPQAVYQSVRYGNFTYTIPNLTPNTNFLVRLHFNELYWNSAGSRVFNVSINGTQMLTNFDIYQTAGGANKALVEDFIKPSDANGKITIQFTTVTDNAMVNGIEIIQP